MSTTPAPRPNLLVRTEASLLALRDSMTPGQRWTASLVLAVIVLLVLFGLSTLKLR